MTKKYWSGYVTKHSFALDLEEGVFTFDDPKKIAHSLKRINRAGKNLQPQRKEILEQAKEELRKLFGR